MSDADRFDVPTTCTYIADKLGEDRVLGGDCAFVSVVAACAYLFGSKGNKSFLFGLQAILR